MSRAVEATRAQPQPPLECLIACSHSSLEGFELARLDQVAHLRAELLKLHEEWIEAEIAAAWLVFFSTAAAPGPKV